MASTSFDDSNWAGHDEYDSNSSVISNNNDNLLIDLGEHASADFWSNVASDGGDIRVTNSAGDTAYSYELENFDSTAETGILFFNSQGLSTSSATTYRVYAGNSSASLPADSDTLGAENVWNDNFEAKYHMDDLIDSTSNGHDMTANGGVTVGGASGNIGAATEFDGSDDYLIENNFSPLPHSSDDTVMFGGWVNTSNNSQNQGIMGWWTRGYIAFFDNNSDGDYEVIAFFNNGSSDSDARTATGTFPDGNWHHIVAVRSGTGASNIEIYIDGSAASNNTRNDDSATNFPETFDFHLGDRANNSWPLDGLLSGAFVMKNPPSDVSNYITTEYNNQNDNATFWTNNGWTAADQIGSVSEANASAVTLSDGSGVTKSD